MTRSAPRATAARASSAPCPRPVVIATSIARPCARATRSAIVRRASDDPTRCPRAPEIGLMMTIEVEPIEAECYYYLPMAQVLRNGYVTLLLVVTLLATVGTVFLDFRFDNTIAGTRASAWSLDRDFGSIDVAIAEFRGAQASYVATAQGTDFWTRRASELGDQL